MSVNHYDNAIPSQSFGGVQDMLDHNTNNIMDLILGSQRSSEKNALHHAVAQAIPHVQASQTHVHVSHHAHHSHAHPHHEAGHHHSRHHQSHSDHAHVADTIEELEVDSDTQSQTVPVPTAAVEVTSTPPMHAQPHLRDELKRAEKRMKDNKHDSHEQQHHNHHSSHHSHHSRPPVPASNLPRGQEDDDVPYDEFGLKKDCHWIQMDFTQNSDNCNQCMTVADAYFRGDEICVCYRDSPGNPLRQKCNELSEKFKSSEDHIRELAVENQWNDYFKSYGLCENFGHCGV